MVGILNDPPSNCKELGKLGHTLNGYYLVHHNENVAVKPSPENKIQVILCRFQLPPGNDGRDIMNKKTAVTSSKNNFTF